MEFASSARLDITTIRKVQENAKNAKQGSIQEIHTRLIVQLAQVVRLLKINLHNV
jgi:hypothetical protein